MKCIWTGFLDTPDAPELRGADTGLKPAQAAHSANPAQRKINEILKTKGKENPQTCSIPAPGTNTHELLYDAAVLPLATKFNDAEFMQ